MKLCTILIPTRKRVPRLLHTIESIRSTSKLENVDICLRLDEDDHETIGALCQIVTRAKQVRIMIGPRYGGYSSVATFCNEMAAMADSKWLCPINDDVTVEGSGWDDELATVKTGIAWPRGYTLGGSAYKNPGCGWYIPFIPKEIWTKLGPVHNPVDAWWHKTWKEHGWHVTTLTKLTMNHARESEDLLEAERARDPIVQIES